MGNLAWLMHDAWVTRCSASSQAPASGSLTFSPDAILLTGNLSDLAPQMKIKSL
jgi:hypothetical protein